MQTRSIRDGSWYWISREILQRYADKIKPIGLALYNIYAYYSNRQGLAFPSQRKIAEMLKISIPTLIKYNKILEKQKLIEVVRIKGKSNRVYLLNPFYNSAKDCLEKDIKEFKTNKNNTNNKYIQTILDYFRKQVKSIKGFEPDVDDRDVRILKQRLRQYSIDDIKQIIDYYLYSQLSDRLGVSIKSILSSHSINLWKLSRQAIPYYKNISLE